MLNTTEYNYLKQLELELTTLQKWFKNYDIQTIQYQRDLRYKGYSNIDIDKLDYEAYQNAERIKTINSEIESLNKTIKKQWEEFAQKELEAEKERVRLSEELRIAEERRLAELALEEENDETESL